MLGVRIGHRLTIVALALFAQCGGLVEPMPVVVLFGGTNDVSPMGGVVGGAFGDTWTWNGSAWVQLEEGNGPPAGSNWAMARFNDSIVLSSGDTWTLTSNYVWSQSTSTSGYSGGCGCGLQACIGSVGMAQLGPHLFFYQGPQGPTLSWSGSEWLEVNPADRCQSPGVYSFVMASLNGAIFLFDGSVTWTFDGMNWTGDMPVVGNPSSRAAMAMAALNDTLVLFGGSDSSNQCLGDTWTFDGTTWTQLNVSGPSARMGAAMAGSGDGKLVLFGGAACDSTVLQDTWVWDGTSWTKLDVPGPPARAFAAMAGL